MSDLDSEAMVRAAWPRVSAWRSIPESAAAHWQCQWTVVQLAEHDFLLEGEDLWQCTLWVIQGRIGLVASSTDRLEFEAGELCGLGLTPRDPRFSQAKVVALEGATHVALLMAADLQALLDEVPLLGGRFSLPKRAGQRSGFNPYDTMMMSSVGSILGRPPVTLGPQATVLEGVRCMQQHGVSSLLLTSGEQGQGELLGVVTDKDVRRAVAEQRLDAQSALLSLATRRVHTLPEHAPVFEALMLMAGKGIHHVPVMRDSEVLGVLSATRLNELHTHSPLALASRVHRQTDLPGLKHVAQNVGALLRQLAAAETSWLNTGRVVSSITDAITSRLIEMAQAELGPAPVPFCWVAAGSQARSEQSARSDQDNCLVFHNSYDPVAHGAYFETLSRKVCDGLDACGYVYCPGEMMAMTPTWRASQSEWQQRFAQWVLQPEPKALMLTCVFFDLRAVHGDASLLDDMRHRVLSHTKGNRIFLAHMASNALSHQPALGMFGQLSTQRSGEHAGTIDLKHNGLVPIVDLARVYALATGHPAVATQDRLAAVSEGSEVSTQSARDLSEAFEFIGQLRIQHQARQVEAGVAADNFLNPQQLSSFERSQLKDAFGVVELLQSVMSQRYTAGRF
ncbi:MAG: putative nucleotidyltransferase substrate binding domain-containing protein [Ideonella sp.]|nr:putative nucleotidyltransferase substrate binding domain-containing protein [Ideonella sp.]